MSSKTYTISALAKEFDVSHRTIRFYEEKGLLAPLRSKGNQRIYRRRDRARLKLILRGKRFGYTLEEIGQIIGYTDLDVDEVRQIQTALAFGERKLRDIRERIEDLVLMEQDLMAVKDKLLKRLNELADATPAENSISGGSQS
jgi:DNA-binding transcriptional MerR regulator